MITKDLLLYENGDGGELAILYDDLLLVEELYQQVYIAFFGGNTAQNTKDKYLSGEERFDYWANTLIWKEKPSKQFNSFTERTLNSVALNGAGRIEILRAMEKDLSYLSDVLIATLDVEFLSLNKIKLIIEFKQKSNQENKVLQLVYDNAKNEVILDLVI